VRAEQVAGDTVNLQDVCIDGNDIYWVEGRPGEGGRNTVVRFSEETIREILPRDYNARTRVHEYGGGSILVVDGTLYFSNFDDQRIYRMMGDCITPLTPASMRRYADLIWDAPRGRLICVMEDHSGEGEAVNSLAAIDPESGEISVLASGHDFYSSPRISPDGNGLAFMTWDHPNMPWDSSELWMAELDRTLGEPKKVAGGTDVSVIHPVWSPEGKLHFVSDPSGWWNLFKEGEDGPENLLDMDAEFGLPHWVFGLSTFGFLREDRILAAYTREGTWKIAEIDTEFGDMEERTTPMTEIQSMWIGGDLAIVKGGSPSMPHSLMRLDLKSGVMDVIRRSTDIYIEPDMLSVPEPIVFSNREGGHSHAFFYPPRNQEFRGMEGELPPLVVKSHGGPTASTGSTLNPWVQYWTSRGFAVLDVNYGGSTGHGRAYRNRLRGMWGVVDMNDCVDGALFLAGEDRVDCSRMVIRGGSAGGYTTLCALAFTDTFAAGASYFGVSDPEMLAGETHKFESRYADSMIGPYPDEKELYWERSPLRHASGISSPVIFFQGLDDKIVLPDQAEMMVEALRKRGVPVAYLPFEGEQHGFRKKENIIRSLEAELYFYAKMLDFEPADMIEPVVIENL